MTDLANETPDISRYFSDQVKIEHQLFILSKALNTLFDVEPTAIEQHAQVQDSVRRAVEELVEADAKNGAKTILPALATILNALKEKDHDETALVILYDLARIELFGKNAESFPTFLRDAWENIVDDFVENHLIAECIKVIKGSAEHDFTIFKPTAQRLMDALAPEEQRLSLEDFTARLKATVPGIR